MYNRSYRQRRPPTVPINYSGNAFERPHTERDTVDVMPIPAPSTIVEAVPIEINEEEKCADACEKPIEEPCDKAETCEKREKHEEKEKPSFLSGLFGGKLFPRGIGSEELLLLALIILVSQSGDADDLLIYLVILLLS